MPQRAQQIKVFVVLQHTPRHNTLNVLRRRVKRQGGGGGEGERGEEQGERDGGERRREIGSRGARGD